MTSVETNGALYRAKVVMLGAPGVGKTSLVRRFVHSVFSEEHHSTLGVKVDRKTVSVPGGVVTMLLWDIHGETDGLNVPDSYLRGTTAAIVTFDASRPETITTAASLSERIAAGSPNAVRLGVANKADLEIDWDALDGAVSTLGVTSLLRTSAKTGAGVESLFGQIASEVASAS